MNDRAVSILEQYDLTVERTWKGRGAILFETKDGVYILKEYKGTTRRLSHIGPALSKIRENGYPDIEEILPNKDGEYFCEDFDRITYIVKRYFQGKECNIRDKGEYLSGIRALARLHNAMDGVGEGLFEITQLPIEWELGKHNQELRRVRKYLKEKNQKSDFERFLQNNFEFFFEQAISITEKLNKEDKESWLAQMNAHHMICHGDYQYHNILMDQNHCCIVNFEKMMGDNPVRDVYLFVRKLLEKNNWDIELGKELLQAYNNERTLQEQDLLQLKYRFYYPEKFWKIVNFYYNSPKAWISCKNNEKLDKLLEQENAKNTLLKSIFQV